MNSFPYDEVVSPEEVNMSSKGIKKVINAFTKQQASGRFPGGQLVIRREGKAVVNFSCGVARGWQSRGGQAMEVTPQTPFPVYSTGKPMAAVVISLLEDRNMIDINKPISHYLPEFKDKNREKITVLDVLTHKGGLLIPDLAKDYKANGDAELLWQKLIAAPPRYPRGTFAYMPIEYGVILDQLVKTLTQKNMPELFSDELVEPLGLNNIHYGLNGKQLSDIAFSYWLGKDKCMVAEMNVADDFEVKNNDNAVFSAKNSAFGMVADASNLAAFYEFLVNNGKSPGGEQLISKDVLENYTHQQIFGWNKSINAFLSFGRGFMLGTRTPSFFGWWGSQNSFGHPGIFSSVAYGDHRTGVSVAIVTNGNKSIGDFFSRFASLSHTIKKACK